MKLTSLFTFQVLILLCGVVNLAASIEVDIDVDCANSEKCVDLKLMDIIDRIDEEPRVPLFGGLDIIKTVGNDSNNGGRSVKESLMDRVRRYMDSHEVKFEENSGRSFDEGRSSRLKKLMLPLLLALKLKLAVVLPIVLSAIALIAIKGLSAGLIAILLSGITALKSLGESKKDHLTAIVPLQGFSHHGHDTRWGRVGQEPQDSGPQAFQPGSPYQSGPQAFQLSSPSFQGSSAPFPPSSQLYQPSSGSYPGLQQSFQPSAVDPQYQQMVEQYQGAAPLN